ncbi:Solute carrier family 22 member 16 [Clarias magur]|uniref:Solute carrier family 22 member 16 n=1 Tax=Clarias magur TaxID=1594786 RepID=A0A8J4XB15_CLAMG|nr:Solute carrier family 22 member 16 [Clarias magur]
MDVQRQIEMKTEVEVGLQKTSGSPPSSRRLSYTGLSRASGCVRCSRAALTPSGSRASRARAAPPRGTAACSIRPAPAHSSAGSGRCP